MLRTTTAAALALALAACGDDSTASTGTGGGAGTTSADAATATGATTSTGSSGEGGAAAVTTTSSGATTSGAGGDAAGSGGSGSGSGGAGAACLQDLSAGHHEVSCEGGITYDVEIPAACVDGACGLIVDMHGYTMTGAAEEENTLMRALGQASGYVIVQPTAPADNLGFPSWDQAVHPSLVHQFLVELTEGLPIDLARIHAMGFSQGGGMTFRLLCQHADFFASGAPIGAIAGCEFEGANTPSEEVDILQVHGRQDAVVDFATVAIPQRDDALGAWDFGDPEVVESDDDHTATRWVTSSGTVLEFWEHDYVTSATAVFVPIEGHCVPGGEDFDGAPAGYSCEDEGTFVFGELAMAFFQAHPKD
jgi:polyhydroxybutyrate depolymerase